MHSDQRLVTNFRDLETLRFRKEKLPSEWTNRRLETDFYQEKSSFPFDSPTLSIPERRCTTKLYISTSCTADTVIYIIGVLLSAHAFFSIATASSVSCGRFIVVLCFFRSRLFACKIGKSLDIMNSRRKTGKRENFQLADKIDEWRHEEARRRKDCTIRSRSLDIALWTRRGRWRKKKSSKR